MLSASYAGPDVIGAGETRRYANGTYEVLGNIEVLSGGTLVLENATFVFVGGPWTLHVHPEATLRLSDATMRADAVGTLVFELASLQFTVQLDPGARFEITDSTFESGQGLVVESEEGIVTRSTFRNNTYGVRLQDVSLPLADNVFENNALGVLIAQSSSSASPASAASDDARQLTGTSSVASQLHNNTFRGNVVGARLEGASATVADNLFENNQMGALVVSGSPTLTRNVVRGGETCFRDEDAAPLYLLNDLKHCLFGIESVRGTPTIRLNDAEDDADPLSRGISVRDSPAALIVDNRLSRWGASIHIENSTAHVHNNTVRANALGARFQAASLTVSDNVFENNQMGALLVSGSANLTGNVVRGGETCFRDEDAAALYLSNDLEHCLFGIYSVRGTPTMRLNTIDDDADPLSRGISVRDSPAAFIVDNRLSRWGTAIHIENSTAHVHNNTVTDSATATRAVSSGSSTVDNNTYEGNGVGVAVAGGQPEVRNNTFRANNVGAALVASGATFHDNWFGGNRVGLQAASGSPTVDTNTFDNDKTCIVLEGTSAIVRSNALLHCHYGLNDTAGQHTLVMNNLVRDDADPLGHGLRFHQSTAHVRHNNISMWETCLVATGGNLTLENNTFADCGRAFDLTNASGDFADNTFSAMRGSGATAYLKATSFNGSFRRNAIEVGPNATGVDMTGSSLFEENVVRGGATCVRLRGHHDVTRNTIERCALGLEPPTTGRVAGNHIANGTPGVATTYGIRGVSSSTATIDGNHVSNVTRAIFGTLFGTITNNSVSNAVLGISGALGAPTNISGNRVTASDACFAAGLSSTPLVFRDNHANGCASGLTVQRPTTLERNTMNTTQFGVRALSGAQLTARENVLRGATGISFEGGAGGLVENNTINITVSGATGLAAREAAVIARGNTFIGAGGNPCAWRGKAANGTAGTALFELRNNTFANCYVHDSSGYSIVEDNHVTNGGTFGIALIQSPASVARRNHVANASYCIYVDSAQGALVQDNLVTGCSTGMYLGGSARQNVTVQRNEVVGATSRTVWSTDLGASSLIA
ncbi:MAG TPA: right-handed parallel beta-helix repeat-containing protein, partial [Candidatus Thermoplasmatota archaeon]|nr:right-handed parallel beta-helix repeat-containing protein [Candidatus Thermoplasmatota archaeon]